MSAGNLPWVTIHPSVYGEAARLLRWADATPRPHGALRYRCPITGSFVLLTDDATLRQVAHPRARVRCSDCGEMHLLTRSGDDPAAVVAGSASP